MALSCAVAAPLRATSDRRRGLRGGRRQHHPSRLGRVHDRDDGARRSRWRGAGRLHAAHAGRPRRIHPGHHHAHVGRENAGRHLHRAVRRARSLGRLSARDGRGRDGDGARHPHRRRAPGGGQRREDGRDDGEEGNSGRRGVRPDARHAASSQREPGRRGGEQQPGVHRRGSAARHSAAHRPRGLRYPGSAAKARRPDDHALRRHVSRAEHALARRRSR